LLWDLLRGCLDLEGPLLSWCLQSSFYRFQYYRRMNHNQALCYREGRKVLDPRLQGWWDGGTGRRGTEEWREISLWEREICCCCCRCRCYSFCFWPEEERWRNQEEKLLLIICWEEFKSCYSWLILIFIPFLISYVKSFSSISNYKSLKKLLWKVFDSTSGAWRTSKSLAVFFRSTLPLYFSIWIKIWYMFFFIFLGIYNKNPVELADNIYYKGGIRFIFKIHERFIYNRDF